MTEKRIPLKGAAEYDGLTRWRKVLYWKPGERKAIKRGYNRRFRRQFKQRGGDE